MDRPRPAPARSRRGQQADITFLLGQGLAGAGVHRIAEAADTGGGRGQAAEAAQVHAAGPGQGAGASGEVA